MIFAAALSKEIDALGSDLFLLQMRLDSLYYNSSAESFVKGWLAYIWDSGWFLLNQAIDVPACQGVLAWGGVIEPGG
jgi:hypothetical protein